MKLEVHLRPVNDEDCDDQWEWCVELPDRTFDPPIQKAEKFAEKLAELLRERLGANWPWVRLECSWIAKSVADSSVDRCPPKVLVDFTGDTEVLECVEDAYVAVYGVRRELDVRLNDYLAELGPRVERYLKFIRSASLSVGN
ncbi:MAG: hypothetical protein DRP27_03640 [Thermotogae bacterium]|nr:MAG: hypothetical protein DRP27_03640 [Thermotogota bacterium]